MRNLTYKYVAVLFAGFLLCSAPAMALSLKDARIQGLVGEQRTGYVAAIKNSKDTTDLVADINARRKAEFTRIGKENGQTPAIVGALASPKIIKGLPAGALYKDKKGVWKARQ